LLLQGLVEDVDSRSIRVKTERGACEILEVITPQRAIAYFEPPQRCGVCAHSGASLFAVKVTFGVHHRAVEAAEDSGAHIMAVSHLEAKIEALGERQAERARVEQRDGLVQSYMASMLTATKEGAAPQVTRPRPLRTYHSSVYGNSLS